MDLCRLVYRSTATPSLLDSSYNLLRLAKQAAEKNSRLEITGLLLLSKNQFLQALEGPHDSINHLYAAISNDDRHKNIRLISFECDQERFFENWSMRLIDVNDLFLGAREILMKKYDCEDGTIQIPTQPQKAFSLLFDAKFFSVHKPWEIKLNS